MHWVVDQALWPGGRVYLRKVESRISWKIILSRWLHWIIGSKEIHAGLLAGLENGALRPIVGKEIPLAEAGRAHKEILEPGAFGKIVLVS